MRHSVQLTHNCIICGKQNLLKLSEHLRQVHQLSCEDRQPWLRAAVFFQHKNLSFVRYVTAVSGNKSTITTVLSPSNINANSNSKTKKTSNESSKQMS